ncbi:MAG: L-threonylcarbamoyladenylate synthase [Planctomycetota bacterium]
MTPQDIARAVDVIRAGGVVGMPTETVYGLACDATNGQAVARVFEVKARPSFDPLIAHVADRAMAGSITQGEWPVAAQRLVEAFWPGPLTLVLPRAAAGAGLPGVAELATSGLDTVAVRCPSGGVARRLIEGAGVPLAAPSANRFGSISPTTAEAVRAELGDAVDVVLDGGPCEHGLESTVVGFEEGGAPVVLRLGAVTLEQLGEVLGDAPTVRSGGSRPAAPGMLDRHYAPRTPMRLVETWEAAVEASRTFLGGPEGRVGLLAPGLLDDEGGRAADLAAGFAVSRRLRVGDDLRASAAVLFAAMRDLDGLGLVRIVVVAAPERGLGRAINDRLRRASAR